MKKALRRCPRLSLVDKVIEISNLDLVKDLAKVLDVIAMFNASN